MRRSIPPVLSLVCVLAQWLSLPLAAQEPSPGRKGPHWDLLPHLELATRERGFARVSALRTREHVVVLRDLLRFAETADEWYRILDAGSAILGEPLREVSGPWRTLSLRMAGEEAWPIPDDYAEWKAELLSVKVDPRMRRFFDADLEPRIPLHEIVWGGVEVDGIPSLDDPKVVKASEASFLIDDEPVFGMSIGGETRAYPLRIADWHEMVNDRLGGTSFALTYCTLCGAGVAYRTDREGRAPFRFGSSGLLMRSNKLMFDRETWSLWNQLTGEPVLGELAVDDDAERVRLDVLPVVLTTWGEWRGQHPDTTVATTDTGVERRYEIGASYGEYFGSPGLMFPAARAKTRTRDKERLFVVRVGTEVVAVPVQRLREEGAVQLEVGGQSVVVLGPPLRQPVKLPKRLRAVLRELGREREAVGDLSFEDLTAAIEVERKLLAAFDAEFLLSLEESVRLEVLEGFVRTEQRRFGLAPSLRDLVASVGLAAPVRAYRGRLQLRRGEDGRWLDPEGGTWLASEAELSSERRDALPRVPGHLVYGFGYDAFFPGGRIAR